MIDEVRVVTAHHEAGHAVAATMRGGATLTSVTLSQRHGEGITWVRHKRWDQAFCACAGISAEARHAWGARPIDAQDDDGLEFVDDVTGVRLVQKGDADMTTASAREALAMVVPRDLVAAPTAAWNRELEAVWSAVQAIARRLLDGLQVTDADVRALID